MPATLELVAAALVGLVLLWIALEPLVVDRSSPSPADADLPDDLEATPHGAALVALKDLEFDHATGKLSDSDFHDLQARYTRTAVTLLRDADAAASGSPAADPIGPERPAQDGRDCPGCGSRPASDTVYCSGCGRRLG